MGRKSNFSSPEERKEHWRKHNREKIRKWRKEHPEDNSIRCKKSYWKNREKRIKGLRRYKQERPEAYNAYSLVHSAKKRNPVCTIDHKWVLSKILNGHCEVTGLPFVLAKNRKPGPWSPSLDRVDSKKGYTPENTRLVVWLYNLAKNEFTDNDVALMANAIIKKVADSVGNSFGKN